MAYRVDQQARVRRSKRGPHGRFVHGPRQELQTAGESPIGGRVQHVAKEPGLEREQ